MGTSNAIENRNAIDRRQGILYPLMVIAAIAVIVFSVAGIATMMGWMPGAASKTSGAADAQSEAAQILHRLLGELDEDKRIAFILSELEGMTAKEISDAFGVKEATIYSRIRAAREKLSAAAEKIRAEGGRS